MSDTWLSLTIEVLPGVGLLVKQGVKPVYLAREQPQDCHVEMIDFVWRELERKPPNGQRQEKRI